MGILTDTKIALSVITVIVGLISAIVEIRKNPEYWLNRFFALFFAFASLGFFGYTIYHIILTNIDFVLTLMITTNILLNFCLACLLMTEFILQYSEVIAMKKPKYMIITFTLFVLSIVGYFIPGLKPHVNSTAYSQGEVDTETPTILMIIVTIYRIVIVIYVLVKFFQLVKQAEGGKVKKQLKLFSIGMIYILIGILLFLFGNLAAVVVIFNLSLGAMIEIIGQICLNIGMIEIARGFLVKN
ncbi:MAG: hypothetical protein ACTSWX_02980 [Promethearchaeota archaeon]